MIPVSSPKGLEGVGPNPKTEKSNYNELPSINESFQELFYIILILHHSKFLIHLNPSCLAAFMGGLSWCWKGLGNGHWQGFGSMLQGKTGQFWHPTWACRISQCTSQPFAHTGHARTNAGLIICEACGFCWICWCHQGSNFADEEKEQRRKPNYLRWHSLLAGFPSFFGRFHLCTEDMKPQPQIPLIWHMLTHRHIISLTHVLNVFALVQLVKNTCVDRAELHQYNDLGLQTIAGYPRWFAETIHLGHSCL